MTNDLANLFKQITHGVYVVGVTDGQHRNAFTASWVMQVSFDPPLLAFSINPEHYSYKLLKAGGICSINVLSKDQLHLAHHFGRHGFRDKMSGFQWNEAKTGAPIMEVGLAYFDCEVSHYADAGDHELVVCRVVDAGALNQGKPMLYIETEDMDGSSELYESG